MARVTPGTPLSLIHHRHALHVLGPLTGERDADVDARAGRGGAAPAADRRADERHRGHARGGRAGQGRGHRAGRRRGDLHVSPVHDDSLYAAAAKVLAADPLIDRVYLKDPGGLLTPERTPQLVPELRAAVGDGVLELHSHCTTGLAPLVYVVAPARRGRAAHRLGSLANGTSQPDALRWSTTWPRSHRHRRGHRGPPSRRRGGRPDRAGAGPATGPAHRARPGLPAAPDPGGMMGTLRRQLAVRGQADLLPHVLEEVGRVREALGWPIMVTPYSQFIGTQAVLNVLAAQHGEDRWSRMPDEVLRYLLGPLRDATRPGRPRRRAAGLRPAPHPRTGPAAGRAHRRRAARLGRPPAGPRRRPGPRGAAAHGAARRPARRHGRRRAGPRLAAGPAAGHLRLDFVRAASELPHWRSLDITLGHECISLRRGAPGGGEAR